LTPDEKIKIWARLKIIWKKEESKITSDEKKKKKKLSDGYIRGRTNVKCLRVERATAEAAEV
jgi:hypothetical protein